jgi:putative mRNA 3-end processing factor
MFHLDRGIKITALDLALDIPRRQPRGFISHAHADHMAPHELAYCTPATARFYRWRYGAAASGSRRLVRELAYGQPLTWGDYRLTTFPAGHVLGAAMLKIEGPSESLLYTGDFRLRPARTAELASPPQADTLVMECTFGQPSYQMPPREMVLSELLGILRRAWAARLTPVLFTYTLGKSQEITRLLTEQSIAVRQHPRIYEVSELYRELGWEVGPCERYEGESIARDDSPYVVVMPPTQHAAARAQLPRAIVTVALTGWALRPAARERLGVDYALPFSDHADFGELLECVERVAPKKIYCLHGPAEFADHLRARGHDARWLAPR